MDEVKPTPDRTHYLKLAGLVALVALGAALANFTPLGGLLSREGVGTATAWLRGSPWAPVVYVGAYAIATTLAIPGSVLTLLGGAVFGVFWGSLYTTIGANIGANLAFLASRTLGRDGVKRLAGHRPQGRDPPPWR